MRKYTLILFIGLTVGCTDQKICEMVQGAHAFYGKNDVTCNSRGFQTPDLYAKDLSKLEYCGVRTDVQRHLHLFDTSIIIGNQYISIDLTDKCIDGIYPRRTSK